MSLIPHLSEPHFGTEQVPAMTQPPGLRENRRLYSRWLAPA